MIKISATFFDVNPHSTSFTTEDLTNLLRLTISYKYVSIIEAVAQRCSVKEVFLEISQNSQENNCARVSF